MTRDESINGNLLVYTGPGSSNSWIWMADFLEGHGFLGSRFVADPGEVLSAPAGSTLIVPGGDTFRIAEAFGESGLAALKGKISGGMGYVGICAGAYLPLKSSIAPLSSFNLLPARISNISSGLPAGIADPEKHSVRYGCSYVFHPARGPVKLSGDRDLIAPIYGGPFLAPSGGEKVHLTFSGVTDGTELLVGRECYDRIASGKAACIEGRHGRGRVLAIAPHLEHPDYPQANDYLRDLLLEMPQGERPERLRAEGCADLKEVRGVVADLRVLASALDARTWKIGVKYWESDKLLFYIDAIRKRIGGEGGHAAVSSGTLARLQSAKRGLRALQDGGDGRVLEAAVDDLSMAASLFLTAHFGRLCEKSHR